MTIIINTIQALAAPHLTTEDPRYSTQTTGSPADPSGGPVPLPGSHGPINVDLPEGVEGGARADTVVVGEMRSAAEALSLGQDIGVQVVVSAPGASFAVEHSADGSVFEEIHVQPLTADEHAAVQFTPERPFYRTVIRMGNQVAGRVRAYSQVRQPE